MAKFLTTEGVSKELSDIIKDATECLVLISPFLKFNERIKEFLAEKNRQNEEFLAEKDRKLLQRIRERINNRQEIDIHVIYGKEKLKPEEKEWLKSMTSIRTKFRKNLHAKCYLNENKALLTSMNLYEFSQVNNDEMGLLVLKEEEPKLYNEIYTESMRIVEVSQEESSEARNTRETPEIPEDGFCIRCEDAIPAKPAQPYCKSCYTSWRRYKNETYKEKNCHTCGNEYAATLLKPLCLTCYKKYKDVFEFADDDN